MKPRRHLQRRLALLVTMALALSLPAPPLAIAHNRYDCKHLRPFYRWFAHRHPGDPWKYYRARLRGVTYGDVHYHRWTYLRLNTTTGERQGGGVYWIAHNHRTGSCFVP